MAKRNGFYSLRVVARELCRLVVKFTPIIQAQFPSNTTLLAALEAANLACAVLIAEIDEVAEVGV